MKLKTYFIWLSLFFPPLLYGQTIGVKTNLLADVTTTFNLGMEIKMSKKITLDLYANYNPWTFGNGKQFKHALLQPEFRYWFCEGFNGHFVGIHAHGGVMSVGGMKPPFGWWEQMETNRYEGTFYGAGISYGYQWVLGQHWNLEGNVGVGYARINYDQYECKTCGKKVGEGKYNYVGPTKAAVSLIYLF